MEVSMMQLRPSPSVSSMSQSAASFLPPHSPYQPADSLPFSSSASSFTSQPFTNLDPSSPAYPYEFERLQIRFRASQESMRIQNEAFALERESHRREREEITRRHHEELEAARRHHDASSRGQDKGKGKRRAE